MSSSDENEGGTADPTGQFDAFRARQAEERAQQETQSAVQRVRVPAGVRGRSPEAVFYPTQPVLPAPANRTRSALIFAGAVLVAGGVLGLGAWLAFGSSSTPAASASSPHHERVPLTHLERQARPDLPGDDRVGGRWTRSPARSSRPADP